MKTFLKGAGPAAVFAAVLALFTSFLAVWWGGVNQDEGWYLYAAQLVREGKLPYRDFFFTQGPALPVVYAAFSGVWAYGSALGGLLGGRIITLCFSLLATGCACVLVRRFVPRERRGLASLTVFALLACNLYHVYFTAIPKTYALGSFFLMAGWLFLVPRPDAPTGGWRRFAFPFLSGLAFAFASGTRISLALALPVVALFIFARARWIPFIAFCAGGFAGAGLTYGFFMADSEALKGLLAAQAYHAGRGGFDPLFAVGSVSRWARGYLSAGVILFAGLAAFRGGTADDSRSLAVTGPRWPLAAMATVFCAVYFLQLSAPFPYDDYQVPLMPMLVTVIATVFAGAVARTGRSVWFVMLVAGLCSFASPLLQEWATAGQDRFWSVKKTKTELAMLRETARAVNALDPEGDELLTQDLYLAVECGRRVPAGLEMGPFSYFGSMDTAEAAARHVMNPERMERLLASAPCTLAAFSGYGFAIDVPRCSEVPFAVQRKYWEILKDRYDLVDSVKRFGQNATTLLVLKRKSVNGEAK